MSIRRSIGKMADFYLKMIESKKLNDELRALEHDFSRMSDVHGETVKEGGDFTRYDSKADLVEERRGRVEDILEYNSEDEFSLMFSREAYETLSEQIDVLMDNHEDYFTESY